MFPLVQAQFIGVECESLMLGFPKTSPSSAHDPVCPPSFCFTFRGVHFRQHLPRFHDCVGSIPSYIPTLESFCRRCIDVGLSLLYTFIHPSPPTSHPLRCTTDPREVIDSNAGAASGCLICRSSRQPSHYFFFVLPLKSQ